MAIGLLVCGQATQGFQWCEVFSTASLGMLSFQGAKCGFFLQIPYITTETMDRTT